MQTLRRKTDRAAANPHLGDPTQLRDNFLRRVHVLTEHNHRHAILSSLDGALPRHLLHPTGDAAYEPASHAPTAATKHWRQTQGAYIAALCGLGSAETAKVKRFAGDNGVAPALRLARELAGKQR